MARECGGCTMCCKVMHVPELEKPAGIWCPHCAVGEGCGIYDERPKPCRDFECLWLQDDGRVLLDADRPDRIGVVFWIATDGAVTKASGQLRDVVIVAESHRNAALGGRARLIVESLLRTDVPIVIGEGNSVRAVKMTVGGIIPLAEVSIPMDGKVTMIMGDEHVFKETTPP